MMIQAAHASARTEVLRAGIGLSSPAAGVSVLRKLLKELFDPYHPERHYMRGPGPRWREKHALDHATVWYEGGKG